MKWWEKLQLGTLVTIVLAMIGFGFYMGGLDKEVKNLKPDKIKEEMANFEEWMKKEKDLLKALPVGTILPFAGYFSTSSNPIPGGWMLCDGSSIPDGSEYNDIRSALAGTEWSESPNKMCLPDLRGKFIRGIDDADGTGNLKSDLEDPDSKERVIGSIQEGSTKLPNSPFQTEISGEHEHTGKVRNNKTPGVDNGPNRGSRGAAPG